MFFLPTSLRRLDPALVGLFVVALTLRVLWTLLADLDLRGKFNYDITWYDISGLTIAARGVFASLGGPPTAASAPGYPALLGATYWVFGQSYFGPQMVNALAGALTCLVTYKLGAHLVSRPAGLLAGWFLAVFPGAILFTPLLMSETVFSLVLTLTCLLFSIWAFRDPEVGLARWIAWGAALGVATLIRATPLALFLVPALIWLVASRSWMYAIRRTAAVLLGFALIVGPWTVRNFLELDAWVLVSTNMGATLVIAKLPEEERQKWNVSRPKGLSGVEANRFDRDWAVRYVMEHPLDDFLRVPSRLKALVWDSDVALYWGRSKNTLAPGVPDEWLSTFMNSYHRVILFMALLGLPFALARDRPERWILPGALAYILALHSLVFQGNPRFLLPFLPILCVLAAMGCDLVVSRWRQRAAVRLGEVQ